MDPLAKHHLLVIEKAATFHLKPLGFRKQRIVWRRRTPELLQQFTLAYKQGAGGYNWEWGMNVLRLCDDPAPRHYRMHARWNGALPRVRDDDERMSYVFALEPGRLVKPDFRRFTISGIGPNPHDAVPALEKYYERYSEGMADAERATLIGQLLERYVIPCCEAIKTEEELLKVLRDPKHPFHTYSSETLRPLVKAAQT